MLETPANEQLQAALEVNARGRALRPHSEAITDGERGENRPDRIPDQRRVEVFEFARAKPDTPHHSQRCGRSCCQCFAVTVIHHTIPPEHLAARRPTNSIDGFFVLIGWMNAVHNRGDSLEFPCRRVSKTSFNEVYRSELPSDSAKSSGPPCCVLHRLAKTRGEIRWALASSSVRRRLLPSPRRIAPVVLHTPNTH